MKIITIGDLHGKNIWKDIVADNPDADKIIFIGDYFDSYERSTGQRQLENFEAIVEFKLNFKNPDDVILLIGNHDFHYFAGIEDRYSGYNEEWASVFQATLEAAREQGLMQFAYLHDHYLFTHAGVTNTWAEKWIIRLMDTDRWINMLKLDAFKFSREMDADFSGDNVYQSPIWVRPDSLQSDLFGDFTQIVGHTKHEGITMQTAEKGKVVYIDVLDYVDAYLEINDNIVIVRKI